MINAFLPCRKGSKRVKNKNTKPFSVFKNGLVELKIIQLLESKLIDKIFISSDDEIVLNIAKTFKNQKIITIKREDNLSLDSTPLSDLIAHALDLIQNGEILWTHTTSPFFKEYDKAINAYLDSSFDSLLSVNELKGFFWRESSGIYTPINYKKLKSKWPRSQDTNSIYEINSAMFIANANIYKANNDRIGNNPLLYKVNKIEGIDIDYNEDFLLAQIIMDKFVENKINNFSNLDSIINVLS